MDNLDMCIALLKQAKTEKQRYKEYERLVKSGADDYEIIIAFGSEPHKSDVNDRIRLVRKLLLKEYI